MIILPTVIAYKIVVIANDPDTNPNMQIMNGKWWIYFNIPITYDEPFIKPIAKLILLKIIPSKSI